MDQHTVFQHSLIVLRGPSGSGKSSIARALRARMDRGTAWVEQDHVRRIMLRERDRPGAANIDLISISVRFALQHGFNVVLEGILRTDHYAVMLEDLHRDYPGTSAWYYLDISFAETVRRHATRPQATDFSTEDMRDWYRPNDLLSFVDETIIGENSTLTDTVDRIYREALTHVEDIPACAAGQPHPHDRADPHRRQCPMNAHAPDTSVGCGTGASSSLRLRGAVRS